MSQMSSRRQLLSFLDATTTPRQHTGPCSDCPWSRKSVPGWLARMTPEEWIACAQGDGLIECHTKKASDGEAWQCAGAARFRSNILKVPRDPNILQNLKADVVRVFASVGEFLTHHTGKPHDKWGRKAS
jgi:hypothetical protein